MTESRVVDVSAIAALLFQEPKGEEIADQIEGFRLVSPSLFSYELTNVCTMKCRRFAADRDLFLAAFAQRDRLNIEELPIDHDGVIALASQTGLTAYDASYLWLSRRLGAELVTLDAALLKASA